MSVFGMFIGVKYKKNKAAKQSINDMWYRNVQNKIPSLCN